MTTVTGQSKIMIHSIV